MAIAGSFLMVALLGHRAAFRVSGHSYLGAMLVALTAVCGLAALAAWLRLQHLPGWSAASIKGVVVVALGTAIYLLSYKKKAVFAPCNS